jgi:hypothetical protein
MVGLPPYSLNPSFYMLMRSFAACGALLALPLLGRAQSVSPASDAPAYRFYVGLGAYTSGIHRLGSEGQGQPFTLPLQATFGYQFQPRLAVQLGVVYSGPQRKYSGSLQQPDGTTLLFSSKARNTATSISALGRYTLTRTPTHRLQVDALGGFTLLHRTFDGSGFYADSNAPDGYGRYDLHSSDYNVLLTGGLSTRYRFSSHFEAVADGTVSTDLRALRAVTASASLGVRYNFSRR